MTFKKSMLKSGMRLELEDGVYLKVGDYWFDANGDYLKEIDYDEDLNPIEDSEESEGGYPKVIRVYAEPSIPSTNLGEHGEVLWPEVEVAKLNRMRELKRIIDEAKAEMETLK